MSLQKGGMNWGAGNFAKTIENETKRIKSFKKKKRSFRVSYIASKFAFGFR
ncbi:hypothetical protein IEN85_00350 [Pelagicoccus sp. NFK12]|uniref:Uncharacterized protein n=1 Tax=Pelagicoccus enzymogenes TaxID=2773457 RepID=A0A927IDF9_9BACT|nr:hypothetical protein [Pelagicoccus enzymogenes]